MQSEEKSVSPCYAKPIPLTSLKDFVPVKPEQLKYEFINKYQANLFTSGCISSVSLEYLSPVSVVETSQNVENTIECNARIYPTITDEQVQEIISTPHFGCMSFGCMSIGCMNKESSEYYSELVINNTLSDEEKIEEQMSYNWAL